MTGGTCPRHSEIGDAACSKGTYPAQQPGGSRSAGSVLLVAVAVVSAVIKERLGHLCPLPVRLRVTPAPSGAVSVA